MADRDMTRKQFVAAVRKHGGSFVPIMGYVEFPLPGGARIGISRLNAGPRLRDQLAYLLRERDRAEARHALVTTTPEED